MSAQPSGPESKVVHPNRALPRKYVEPILFLADRMSEADGTVLPKERKVVEELAKAANLKDFRHEDWYRKMNEDKACQAINIDSARQGLLVVLSLLLKADESRKDTEHAYFSKIRSLVGGDPVHVPIDFESHKKLALEYIVGGR
jgi:hypothetical protein